MIQSIHPRVRIALVLTASFIVSGFIMKYASESSQETAPNLKVNSIVSDFSRSISHTGSGILATIQSIHVPSLVSFVPFPSTEQPQEEPIEPTEPPYEGWVIGATATPQPTAFPTLYVTSSPVLSTTPTTKPLPTAPRATNTPKPTSKPKPSPTPPLPPITSEIRPGSNLEEVYADVAKRMCVPVALMKAIQTEETGDRLVNYAKTNFKFINTYGWWNTDKATQLDYFNAAAYSAQSGYAPPDSKFAGIRIAKPIQPDAYDQMIMGLLQISQQEQDLSFKNTSKVITSGKIDRRILYDNALIFASVTLNKVGNLAETGCGDWSLKAIARAACKHLGGCNYNYGANNGNYCTKICDHYNSFAGTHYNCGSAASLMVANGDDGQCTLK